MGALLQPLAAVLQLRIGSGVTWPGELCTCYSQTCVCAALSDPARSIMYKIPVFTASLSVILDLAVCLTFTMSSAWLLLDVLLAAVGSCVRSLLPRESSRIT